MFSRDKTMKVPEFDRAFDDGKSVVRLLDLERARRPGLEQRRVNVDLPSWMVRSIDREARRLGMTRQSLIKLWLADRLQQP